MVEREAGVPWESPKLRAILACTLVLPLGVAMVSPILPVVRDAFVVTDARASLLITLYFLPGVVLSPVIGLLADRYGRRVVVIPSVVAFGVTGGSIAFVDDFAVILAIRVLQGAAAAGVFILTVTFISDTFDGVQRNAVLGINGAVLLGGAAFYPFLGGFLGSYEWHLPFLLYFLAVPVAVYATPRLDESPLVIPRCGPGYIRGAAEALPRVEAGLLYGATFLLETVAFGSILTVVPFLLKAELDASSVTAGAVITVMASAAAVVSSKNGSLARHRSNHRLLAFCACLFGVGLLVAWSGHSLPVIMTGVAIFGAGFGLLLPSVDAEIGRIAPPEYRAGALSLRNVAAFSGRSVGPILFTSAAVVTGYRTLLLAAGAGTLVVGAVGVVLTDGHPPTADAVSS